MFKNFIFLVKLLQAMCLTVIKISYGNKNYSYNVNYYA